MICNFVRNGVSLLQLAFQWSGFVQRGFSNKIWLCQVPIKNVYGQKKMSVGNMCPGYILFSCYSEKSPRVVCIASFAWSQARFWTQLFVQTWNGHLPWDSKCVLGHLYLILGYLGYSPSCAHNSSSHYKPCRELRGEQLGVSLSSGSLPPMEETWHGSRFQPGPTVATIGIPGMNQWDATNLFYEANLFLQNAT